MTYKGKGVVAHEEYNLPLTEDAYNHMIAKADGNIIRKSRYRIPYGEYTIELDIFEAPFAPLTFAEVEFPTEDEADAFVPPDWFMLDVTYDRCFSNAYLSKIIFLH
jgi:CYTH domain-containing protein